MKHAEMRAVVHNIADSLASGCSLLTGFHEGDAFQEVNRSGGRLVVDALRGIVVEGNVTPEFSEAIQRTGELLPELIARAGGDISELIKAEICFWSDLIQGQISIEIQDVRGRRTSTRYAGVPAKRVRSIDSHGRLRPIPAQELSAGR